MGLRIVVRADELRPGDLVSDATGAQWHVESVQVRDGGWVDVDLRESRSLAPEIRFVVWRPDCAKDPVGVEVAY